MSSVCFPLYDKQETPDKVEDDMSGCRPAGGSYMLQQRVYVAY